MVVTDRTISDTRYLLADTCERLEIPLVNGGGRAIRRLGHGADALWPRRRRRGAPARGFATCFPESPPPGLVPSCAEAGVVGALTGVIGQRLKAMEVIKLITGAGEPLIGAAAAL